MVIMLIFTVTTGLSPNFYLYMASQFLVGVAFGGFWINCIVLGKVMSISNRLCSVINLKKEHEITELSQWFVSQPVILSCLTLLHVPSTQQLNGSEWQDVLLHLVWVRCSVELASASLLAWSSSSETGDLLSLSWLHQLQWSPYTYGVYTCRL